MALPTLDGVDGQASISSDVVASYAADAAREVVGVRGLVDNQLRRHRGVRVSDEDGRISVELHLAVAWGSSIPEVGEAVQRRVSDYLTQMTGSRPQTVDVIVDEIGPPS
jgi:uncharacterized alkaline shock family protein YloU